MNADPIIKLPIFLKYQQTFFIRELRMSSAAG
jgi:hypothetical protein